MTLKAERWATIVCLWGLVLASCGKNEAGPSGRVNVVTGTNGHLVLRIEAFPRHALLFSDPRVSPSTARFDWELFSGRDPVLSSANTVVTKDPLSPDHLDMGPVFISPDTPVELDLTYPYPELTIKLLAQKGDCLLWYCRLWDCSANQWAQGSGVLKLGRNRP